MEKEIADQFKSVRQTMVEESELNTKYQKFFIERKIRLIEKVTVLAVEVLIAELEKLTESSDHLKRLRENIGEFSRQAEMTTKEMLDMIAAVESGDDARRARLNLGSPPDL